jgi:hypothetical protein
MNTKLERLNKKELLEIIGKMKKTDLINIINYQQKGGSQIIKIETENAIRTPLEFDPTLKIDNIKNYAMSNNSLYNKTYNEINKNNKNKNKNKI